MTNLHLCLTNRISACLHFTYKIRFSLGSSQSISSTWSLCQRVAWYRIELSWFIESNRKGMLTPVVYRTMILFETFQHFIEPLQLKPEERKKIFLNISVSISFVLPEQIVRNSSLKRTYMLYIRNSTKIYVVPVEMKRAEHPVSWSCLLNGRTDFWSMQNIVPSYLTRKNFSIERSNKMQAFLRNLK